MAFESLRSGNDSTKNKRATLALEFFENTLDPVIKEEKDQLDVFAKYHAALNSKFLLETRRPDLPYVDSTQLTAFNLTLAKSSSPFEDVWIALQENQEEEVVKAGPPTSSLKP